MAYVRGEIAPTRVKRRTHQPFLGISPKTTLVLSLTSINSRYRLLQNRPPSEKVGSYRYLRPRAPKSSSKLKSERGESATTSGVYLARRSTPRFHVFKHWSLGELYEYNNILHIIILLIIILIIMIIRGFGVVACAFGAGVSSLVGRVTVRWIIVVVVVVVGLSPSSPLLVVLSVCVLIVCPFYVSLWYDVIAIVCVYVYIYIYT